MESGRTRTSLSFLNHMSQCLCRIWLCCTVGLAMTAQNLCWSQSLLNELVTDGIEFREGVTVKLPAPALAGVQSKAELAKAKTQLSGNDSWERFTRDSIVAPVTIKLEYVTDADGNRVGHNVYSAFVVHAKFESLDNKDLMQQIFGKAPSSDNAGNDTADDADQVEELSRDELTAAGISVPEQDAQADTKVTYSKVAFTLLDKIRLNGVLRVERTTRPGSTTIAWKLDPAFEASDKWRGTWTRIDESESTPQPYKGWGGYLNVTRVGDSPEKLVLESRMLLHEPQEWFNASNFVRSKLPLAIQESARNFRRRLKAE